MYIELYIFLATSFLTQTKQRYKNKSVEDKSRYDQEMMEYVARLKQAQREDLVPRSMKKHLKNL